MTQYEDKIFGVRIIHSQSTSIRPREETTFEDLITFDEEDDNGLKCKYKFTAKQKRRRRIISLDHTSIHWHCCQGVSLGPNEGKVLLLSKIPRFFSRRTSHYLLFVQKVPLSMKEDDISIEEGGLTIRKVDAIFHIHLL